MRDAVVWWLAVQLFGAAALPITLVLFRRLPDRGVFFARAIGLLVPTYVTWLLASLHLVPYGTLSTPIVATVLFAATLGATWRKKVALLPELAALWRARGAYLIVGEILFVVLFAGWCWLRAYSPDVAGTEKFMDMAFINAINRSRYFPPYDPWLSGATINYYYLGHLMFASLIRVTGVAPTIGFVLSVPLIAALAGSSVYSIAGNLIFLERREGGVRVAAATGLVAALFCTTLGNLAGALQAFQKPSAPKDFNWWDPSRVIPHTINEFPFFSFLLADLHAHVMAIPFGLLVVAMSLELSLTPSAELFWWRKSGQRRAADDPAYVDGARDRGTRAALVDRHTGPALGIVARPIPFPAIAAADRGQVLFVSSAIAAGSLYVLNGWDYPTYMAVLVIPLAARAFVPRVPEERLPLGMLLAWCIGIGAASLVVMAPFLALYRPPTGGIGLVHDRTSIGQFLTVYGLPVFVIGTWLLTTVARDAKPNRRLVIIVISAVLFMAMLLEPAHLDVLGLTLFASLMALELLTRARAGTAAAFVAGLVLVAGLLLAVEEVVYLRDAFQLGPEYRMNTVFKFGYVAWLFLSVAGAFSVSACLRLLKPDARAAWAAVTALLVAASLVYTSLGAYSKSQQFAHLVGLDGFSYLRTTAPGDAAAIRWLQSVPGRPVVLEAIGDDYSDFGRVSTYTGLPSVLGWEGHEAQWGHPMGQRRADVATMYSTPDPSVALPLLRKYDVRYVFIGTLERRTYPTGLAKFARMGRVVVDTDGTQVVDVGG